MAQSQTMQLLAGLEEWARPAGDGKRWPGVVEEVEAKTVLNACVRGQLPVVQRLLEAKADVEASMEERQHDMSAGVKVDENDVDNVETTISTERLE